MISPLSAAAAAAAAAVAREDLVRVSCDFARLGVLRREEGFLFSSRRGSEELAVSTRAETPARVLARDAEEDRFVVLLLSLLLDLAALELNDGLDFRSLCISPSNPAFTAAPQDE